MSFTIYTKVHCTYCDMAKFFLAERDIPFTEIKIPDDISKEEIQARVTASGSDAVVSSVPQVFEGDTYIGGARELGLHIKNIKVVM